MKCSVQLAKKIFSAEPKNELWEEHLEDPVAALAKVLGCLEAACLC